MTCPINSWCVGCAKCDPAYHQKRAAKLRINNQEKPMLKNLGDYAPPDPYAIELAEIRAASATPESRREEAVLQAWTADIEKSRMAMAVLRAAQQAPVRLTAAELKKYAPPNPYEEALRALKEGGR